MNISRILKEGHQIKIRSVDNKTVEGKKFRRCISNSNERNVSNRYVLNK